MEQATQDRIPFATMAWKGLNVATDFRQYIKDAQIRLRMGTHVLAKRAGLKSTATLYTFLKGDTEMTSNNLTRVLDVLSEQDDNKPE